MKLKAICRQGTFPIALDMGEAHETDEVTWELKRDTKTTISNTIELEVGDPILIKVTENFLNHVGDIRHWSVHGFMVPENYLGRFLLNYKDTDLEIYPIQEKASKQEINEALEKERDLFHLYKTQTLTKKQIDKAIEKGKWLDMLKEYQELTDKQKTIINL